MKKAMCIIIAVVLVIATSSVCVFACTIGDDALRDESALVFIGMLEEYSEDEKQQIWSGKAKIEERIKGDAVVGETIAINGRGIDSKIKKGTLYLFISFPNSETGSTYIVSIVEKQDDQILLHRHNRYDNHLQEQVEKYINDGSYAKAEAERVNKLTEEERAALGENKIVEIERKPNVNYTYLIVATAVVIISGVAVIIALKKKKQK